MCRFFCYCCFFSLFILASSIIIKKNHRVLFILLFIFVRLGIFYFIILNTAQGSDGSRRCCRRRFPSIVNDWRLNFQLLIFSTVLFSSSLSSSDFFVFFLFPSSFFKFFIQWNLWFDLAFNIYQKPFAKRKSIFIYLPKELFECISLNRKTVRRTKNK